MFKPWVLFLFPVLFLSFACISLSSSPNKISDIEVTDKERGFLVSDHSKNLKETSRNGKPNTLGSENKGEFNEEDYGPVDPSPTTKASIRPGPIQHGTPLNPYIPKPPSSPTHPRDGG
ncbi:PREDICTED: uncharacterized protein LOC104825767 [Tarenaya hassleriana]|uniref:uncharacterized protein LOC104825767 n=1 Tax=Tarenaya hassleriana TaxID=28532 RepID=UPI00053C3AD2|nr:PREDICTED: uncharacterized protein LOC104825767 [Tarenaya hassleriana]XP_019059566.1 PREDICTED: uncharacterized protein LOC104825767 [Tarenaya hassleriana]